MSKEECNLNSQGHPTHPQIPTLKYARVNKVFPDGYIGSPDIYRRYPYPTTRSGKRNPVIKQKWIVDGHEYSLIQSEWSNIIKVYTEEIFNYLLRGHTYKINRWLGTIRLYKTYRGRRAEFQKYEKYGVLINFKNTHINGYSLGIGWYKKKFKFRDIWRMRVSNSLMKYAYGRLEEDSSLIWRISDAPKY